MPIHFLITKVIPVLAILAIYWIGSFNLPNIIFLPLAAAIVFLVIIITKRYGDKDQSKTKKEQGKSNTQD